MNNLDGSIYNALVAAKLASASGGGGGNIASNNVTAMTGYEEAETASSIETTDSLNQAVGKLEKGIDDNKTNILSTAAIGTCETAGNTAAKVVTISGDWTLRTGVIIGVKFTYTNSASNVTLNVNGSGDKSIYFGTGVYTGASAHVAGNASVYTFYQYDGTYWVWLTRSTYSDPQNMTQAEASAGTETRGRLISAKVLSDTIDEKIQPLENNILSNWGGAKNLATITSGTFTAPSGTRYTTIPLSQPISGDIVVYFGSLTSDDTQDSTCAIVVSSATETLSTINMERGSSESATVTITSEATKILIYPAAGYSTSSGKTVTWSNLMVCSKADWDKTQAYSDPAMSNVELTAAIRALQAQLAE